MKSKETIEEVAKKYVEQITIAEFGKPHKAPHRIKSFIDGANWQSERMYSEEEVLEFANWCRIHDGKYPNQVWTIQDLFEKYEKETLKTK
jgi:hypothetical protein